MAETNPWRDFFNAYAPRCIDEVFARGTAGGADATTSTVAERFDEVQCLCEGGLLSARRWGRPIDRDSAVLRCVHEALRSGGRFILTALRAVPLVRPRTRDDAKGGLFDPLAVVETEESACETPAGPRTIADRQRVCVPTGPALLFRLASLTVEHVWAAAAGSFGRRPIGFDEMEIMVVARRT